MHIGDRAIFDATLRDTAFRHYPGDTGNTLCAMQALTKALCASRGEAPLTLDIQVSPYSPSTASTKTVITAMTPGVCDAITSFVIAVNDHHSQLWPNDVYETTMRHVLPYLVGTAEWMAADGTALRWAKMFNRTGGSLSDLSPRRFIGLLNEALAIGVVGGSERRIPPLPDSVQPVTDEELTRILGHDAGPASDLQVGPVDGTVPVAAPHEAVPLAGDADAPPELVFVGGPHAWRFDHIHGEPVAVGTA